MKNSKPLDSPFPNVKELSEEVSFFPFMLLLIGLSTLLTIYVGGEVEIYNLQGAFSTSFPITCSPKARQLPLAFLLSMQSLILLIFFFNMAYIYVMYLNSPPSPKPFLP
ncbi:hypothetical protein N9Y89_00195 [bacterium]|nr:hypothetical protein [bacterium]